VPSLFAKRCLARVAIVHPCTGNLNEEMVTCTANDSSSELIASVRRGPFTIPDENERVEYLLSRKRALRAPIEKHAVLHVLSYQRRVNAIKNVFFARGSKTPLGHGHAHVCAQPGGGCGALTIPCLSCAAYTRGDMKDWWDRRDLNW
jgi:hypothetical protein